MASKPIGVFDSGVGGLTVLASLVRKWPHQDFVYLGDTARLPYGSKSPATIRAYTEQNLKFLKSFGVEQVVIACNSASTQASDLNLPGLEVFPVIEPTAKMALSKTDSGAIGVIGTRATILSGLYQRVLEQLAADKSRPVQVMSVACPLFVPLAEENWGEDPLTNLVAYRYLQPLVGKVDTLILGCTHYPILKSAFSKIFGTSVELIESGPSLIHFGKDQLHGKTSGATPGKIQVLLTDESPQTAHFAEKLLPSTHNPSIEVVDFRF